MQTFFRDQFIFLKISYVLIKTMLVQSFKPDSNTKSFSHSVSRPDIGISGAIMEMQHNAKSKKRIKNYLQKNRFIYTIY